MPDDIVAPCNATSNTPNPLQLLDFKRAKFVTCPACRHGGTTVLARERLSTWRYAAGTTVAIVFAPLTFGVMLLLLPILFRPVFTTHRCRRCGLRLALATGGVLEYQFTVGTDIDDDRFQLAPEGWRADLARPPGGLRVALSPLGPPAGDGPEPEKEMKKVCGKRFTEAQPGRQLRLVPDRAVPGTTLCYLDGEDETEGALYVLQGTGIGSLDLTFSASDAWIFVKMRPPPQQPEEDLPAYTKQPEPVEAALSSLMPVPSAASSSSRPPLGKATLPTDKKAKTEATSSSASAPSTSAPSTSTPTDAPPFPECCRIQLFANSKRKYATVMYPRTTSASSSSYSSSSTSARINAISARLRTQFSPTLPAWRWWSSAGGLMWVSRKMSDGADSDGTRETTRLCLVDDYDRLVATADTWRGVCMDTSLPAGYTTTVTLYAELGAQVLGEILGSLATLAVQVGRVGRELDREKREREAASS